VGAAISTELEAVILKALAKDPKGRWQTAEEFSTALAKVPEMSGEASSPLPAAGGATAAGTSPTVAAKANAPGGARPNYVPWAIAGGLALLLLLVVLMARRPSVTVVTPAPPPPPKVTTAPPPSTSAPGAQRHLAQAVDYQRRLWCSDAIEELEKALRDDDGLRDDPTLQRTAIACLTPKTRERAIRLLAERVGPASKGELERAATDYPNAEVRKGARETLDRLPR
jgi:hypothetical protein